MDCPVCGAALELLGHGSYGGLRFHAQMSVFRCTQHGPILLRREGIPGPDPGRGRGFNPDVGDPGEDRPGVRAPLWPRSPSLAGAIALPEPDDSDDPDDADRPADGVARVADRFRFR